jgi:glycosyltransferase involved in cell wall biosynthesis
MRCLLLLTPDRWSHDPRARRAAQAAADTGWSVVGIDVADHPDSAETEARLIHVRTGAPTAALRRAGLGGRGRRKGALLRELRGVYRLARSIALSVRMARAAREVDRIDVVQANDHDTLLAGLIIARRRHARLVYDAHEIYGDQEPDAPRVFRLLARRIERVLARRADAVVTVSEPIAAELRTRLGLRRRPEVVLNCPPLEPKPAQIAGDGTLRVIYQGAMGPGRYIDDLFEIARNAERFRLAIRVIGVAHDELQAEIDSLGLAGPTFVLPPVQPRELVSALGDFDVGLIINRPVTRNDELVLPNKLFEYLMAGLPVVAPRLPSLHELLDGQALGKTFEPGSPRDAARVLNALAEDPTELASMGRRAREAAVERYNAEAQRPALAAAWGAR